MLGLCTHPCGVRSPGGGLRGTPLPTVGPGVGALACCFRLGVREWLLVAQSRELGGDLSVSLKEEVPLAAKFPKRSAWGWETGNATRAALACGHPPRPPGHSPPGGPSAPRGEGGDAAGGPCLHGGPGGGAGHRPWVSPSRVSRGRARADGGPRSFMGSATRTPASQTQAPPGRPRPPARSRGESHRP